MRIRWWFGFSFRYENEPQTASRVRWNRSQLAVSAAHRPRGRGSGNPTAVLPMDLWMYTQCLAFPIPYHREPIENHRKNATTSGWWIHLKQAAFTVRRRRSFLIYIMALQTKPNNNRGLTRNRRNKIRPLRLNERLMVTSDIEKNAEAYVRMNLHFLFG